MTEAESLLSQKIALPGVDRARGKRKIARIWEQLNPSELWVDSCCLLQRHKAPE